MRLPLLALSLACLLPSFIAPAHASDSAVGARLDARGIKYEVDEDGDYRVVISYKSESRTQLVFVSGATETVNGLVVREVFSPAGKVDADNVDDKALELLTQNRSQKIGAWEVGGNILYYVIKLPDSVDAALLEAAIEIAAESADDKEIELSGDKDAY